jgi:hypothetical protein
MRLNESNFNVLDRIKDHLEQIHPILPNQIFISTSEDIIDSLKASDLTKRIPPLNLLQIIHTKEVALKTIDDDIINSNSMVIRTDFEPHYWFDIYKHLEKDEEFVKKLVKKVFGYHKEVMIFGYLSEGHTSGILPVLCGYLVEERKNAVFLGIFPSINFSSDALFNAYSSLGLLLSNDVRPIILIDDSMLKNFIGISHDGEILTQVHFIKNMVKIFFEREGLIKDLVKISTIFNIDIFSVLVAFGASLKIYGSFRNILELTLEQRLMELELSSVTFLYMITRIPSIYKEKLTKEDIELEVNDWTKDKIQQSIPQICDSYYHDEYGDRIDVIILVGGYDNNKLFTRIFKKIRRFDELLTENTVIDKKVWENLKNKMEKY